MLKPLLAATGLALVASFANGQARLLVAAGPNFEVFDATSWQVVARRAIGPGDSRAIAVSFDRRHALVSEDSAGPGRPGKSLVILDLTQAGLPEVTRIDPGIGVLSIATTPFGQALVAGTDGTSGKLVVVDLTLSPPAIVQSVKTSGGGHVQVAPDGRTAYSAGANGVDVIDLRSSPAVVAATLPIPLLQSIGLSHDGVRLLAVYSTGGIPIFVRVFDTSIPTSPVRLVDLQIVSDAAQPGPHFQPGDGYALLATQTVRQYSPNDFHVIDGHTTAPAVRQSVRLGFDIDALVATGHGDRAVIATNVSGGVPALREVDLSAPTSPTMTSRVHPSSHRTADLVRAGAVHVVGSPALGSLFSVFVSSPVDAGRRYALAASLSTRPGITLGGRLLSLAPDGLFAASRNLPSIFQSFDGSLDANGQARAAIAIPASAALRGVSFFVAGIAIHPAAPNGVANVFDVERLTIR